MRGRSLTDAPVSYWDSRAGSRDREHPAQAKQPPPSRGRALDSVGQIAISHISPEKEPQGKMNENVTSSDLRCSETEETLSSERTGRVVTNAGHIFTPSASFVSTET